MDFLQSMSVSGQGMMAETVRMRVATENIANANSVMNAEGTGPYRAKQVYFKTVMDKASGMTSVRHEVRNDYTTPMQAVYNPKSELADARGFVMHPNVDVTIENLNLREAQRAYEANMAAIGITKDMAARTLDILR